MITRSVLDTRYVAIPLSATGSTGAVIDPTSDVVHLAFVPQGVDPADGDWLIGSWATDGGGGYQAQCLVGPANGGVVLAPGVYQIWVRVADSPEAPVFPADLIKIV